MRLLAGLIAGLLQGGAVLSTGGPQLPAGAAFAVVPLGVKGGLAEGNLSAYLVAEAGSTDYVCLDAGSLRTGIERAEARRPPCASTSCKPWHPSRQPPPECAGLRAQPRQRHAKRCVSAAKPR